ncbi:DUF928 domain-containing protein [Spirulina subsalsa FACHB-351]|uniref:DUF928 domain-containing protein n=1 Tax=Spirulina subsalsa FACHB-351 TaxID=234711 RepID=A0ABT3L2L7_9CYAN|nr:DUF928 domain-containing protein [Spirulina subsalsa]MCW6035702.1 DUF928 domain-containing protein [Spirulina subsalsa FACHB-351]
MNSLIKFPKFLQIILLMLGFWSYSFSLPSQTQSTNNLPLEDLRLTQRNREDEDIEDEINTINRPGCPQLTHPLTPIVIHQERPGNRISRFGETTQEHPTIWVYIPYETAMLGRVIFDLRDRDQKLLYEFNVPVRNTPGFIQIPLNKDYPLEIDQSYQWHVSIDMYCAENSPAQFDSTSAWIRRVSNSSSEKLIYDRLTNLNDLDPNQQQSALQSLLRELGLDSLQNEPMSNCCKP